VIFEDFGDNALIFDLFFWCDASGERELRQLRSDLRFRITDLFSERGIVIAFPQRDVHLDSVAPIEVRVVGSAGVAPGE
jgi:small-conductance mechanosensitive channel